MLFRETVVPRPSSSSPRLGVSSSSTKLVLSLVAEEERAFQERIYVGVQRSSRIGSKAPNARNRRNALGDSKSCVKFATLLTLASRSIRSSESRRSVARWRSRNRLPNRSHESKTNARRKGGPSIFPHPHQIESERPPARRRGSSRTIVTLRSRGIIVQPWSFPGSVARQKQIRDDRGDRGDFRSSIKSGDRSPPFAPSPSPPRSAIRKPVTGRRPDTRRVTINRE